MLKQALLPMALFAFACGPLRAQDEAGPDELSRETLEQRLLELEKRLEELEDDTKTPGKKKSKKKEKPFFSDGIATVGGAEIKIGGKIELNLIDAQAERSPFPTDNPDTYLDFDRIRLEPELDIGRGLSFHSQLDFFADEGDTLVKEGTVVHRWRPRGADGKKLWWFRSHTQIGMDDRFIHRGPGRRVSESYPLVGTAYWRDEEIALMWIGTLGRKRGNPREEPKEVGDYWAPRKELTNSTSYHAFDFEGNPGELTLSFSLGDGYTLDGKSVNKDRSNIQEVLQDDRESSTGLSLNEIGLGVGYERDFNWLGEIGLQVFYYTGDLNSESVRVLQQELTSFDATGTVITGGYGLSQDDNYHRAGVSLDYHIEAFHFFDRYEIHTEPGDGLYLTLQFVQSKDGALDRHGWYAQGSYRFSLKNPLFFDYFVRSFEFVARYGELKLDDLAPIPTLPLTWGRRQLFFGGVVGLTNSMSLKAEYSFHGEKTGGGDVANDQLLFQLLVDF